MHNIFKELPWSTIRVLKYIVKEYKEENFVGSLEIRKHFKFKKYEEQKHLELLKKHGFIDNTGNFFDHPGINRFRLTAKAWTSVEMFSESLIIFLVSSFVIPATISTLTTLIANYLIKK